MPERHDLRRNEDAMGVKFQDLTLAKGIELRTGARPVEILAANL